MYLLYLILLFANCESYNILCLLPYPGKSHHLVFDPLLNELVNRGHNLTVVSFFPSEEKSPNRRDVSLVGLSPVNVEVIDLQRLESKFPFIQKHFGHVPIVTELAYMHLKLCQTLLQAEVFKEFVKAEGAYDLIITEHFNSDCMLGLVHNYGLPSVGLSSCQQLPWHMDRHGAPDNPSYVPNMVLPFTEKMTLFERVENAFFNLFYEVFFEVFIRRKEQELLEKVLGKELPKLGEIAKNTSVMLINAHHSVNGVRLVPPSIIEVGGIHLHNKKVQPLPQNLENWLSESEYGFILFSFGSLVRGSTLPRKYVEMFFKVFSKLTQKVIWKWEDDITDGLPENVRVMKWIPQYDLLHHSKCVALITHAGMLGMTEALSAGVPMLVIPLLGDQFGNAAHASAKGIAQVMSFNELNEQDLRNALDKVLSEEMATQAKAVSRMWHDRPISPMDNAIYHVEYAAKYKLPLSSHARYLSRLQTLFLDVIGVICISVTIAMVIVLVAVKLCRSLRKTKVD